MGRRQGPGPGWWKERRRHRWAALKGWRRRREVAAELRRYHERVLTRKGHDLALDRTRQAERVISTTDRRAIASWKKDPAHSDVVDVDTLRALAAAKGRARKAVRTSRKRVEAVTRRARRLQAKVRRRRDLSPERKAELAKAVEEAKAKAVRRETRRLKKDLRKELEAGRLAVRVYARKRWPPERKRRARLVADTLGIDNVLVADLLIRRAERAGAAWDTVNWDAVQVMGKRSDYTEFVAQLDRQLGVETVTADEAARMVEVRVGKFVDVENEIDRAADEYERFLRGLARKGEIHFASVADEVARFRREARGRAEAVVEGVARAHAEEAAAEAERRVEAALAAHEDDVEAAVLKGRRGRPTAADGGRVEKPKIESFAQKRLDRFGVPAATGSGGKRHYVPEHGKQMPSGRRRGSGKGRGASPGPSRRTDALASAMSAGDDGRAGRIREAVRRMSPEEIYEVLKAGQVGGIPLDPSTRGDLILFLYNGWRAEGYGVRSDVTYADKERKWFEDGGYEVRVLEDPARPGKSVVLFKPKKVGGYRDDPDRLRAKIDRLIYLADEAGASDFYLKMMGKWERRIASLQDGPDAPYAARTITADIEDNWLRYSHTNLWHRIPLAVEGTDGLERARLLEMAVDREIGELEELFNVQTFVFGKRRVPDLARAAARLKTDQLEELLRVAETARRDGAAVDDRGVRVVEAELRRRKKAGGSHNTGHGGGNPGPKKPGKRPIPRDVEDEIERIFWSTVSITDSEREAFDSMWEDAEPIAKEVGTTAAVVRKVLADNTGFKPRKTTGRKGGGKR